MANLFDLRDKLTFDESLRYFSDAGFTLNAQELFHFVLEKKIQLKIFSYTRNTQFTISSIQLLLRKQPYWCMPEDGSFGFIIYVDTERLRLTKYIVNRNEYGDRPISQCMWDATDYYVGFLTEDIRSLLEQALKISEKAQSIPDLTGSIKNNYGDINKFLCQTKENSEEISKKAGRPANKYKSEVIRIAQLNRKQTPEIGLFQLRDEILNYLYKEYSNDTSNIPSLDTVYGYLSKAGLKGNRPDQNVTIPDFKLLT